MRKYPLILILFFCLASCDTPECTNHNPVFEKHDPKSNEYKTELVKQLLGRNPKWIVYSINCYDEVDSTPYLVVDIASKNLCAVGYLDITNSDRMAQFRAVKGVSYRGAGLSGLKYHIDSSTGNYNFIFDDVNWIMD